MIIFQDEKFVCEDANCKDTSQSMMQCPNEKMNTQSRKNEQIHEDVASWEACSELCRQREDCTHWTWHHDEAGFDGGRQWARKCMTMTGFVHTNVDDNAVSGDRDCGSGGK